MQVGANIQDLHRLEPRSSPRRTHRRTPDRTLEAEPRFRSAGSQVLLNSKDFVDSALESASIHGAPTGDMDCIADNSRSHAVARGRHGRVGFPAVGLVIVRSFCPNTRRVPSPPMHTNLPQ